jgi:hypothetical protein
MDERALALLFRHVAGAVLGKLDVAVTVDLEGVPEFLIKDNPAHHKVRVVNELIHGLRIAKGVDEAVARESEGEVIELSGVCGKSVVHVEPNSLNVTHVERAIAEDAPARD